MLLCVQELSKLTKAFAGEIVVPLHLTRLCQWPLLKILQGHPTDNMLGSYTLSVLRQFSNLKTPATFEYASIHDADDRLTARGIVSDFLERFSQLEAVWATLPPDVRQQMFAVRQMLNAGEDVLTWIDGGTIVPSDDREF